MKLHGSSEKKMRLSEAKNGGNVPRLEVTEIVLVHCNRANNTYQHDSRVLCTFTYNKTICELK